MQNNISFSMVDNAGSWAKYLKELSESTENKVRKSNSKTLKDYYDNKQLGYLTEELNRLYTDKIALANIRKLTANLVKFCLDNLGTTYSGIVRRDIASTEGVNKKENLNDLFFTGLDDILGKASRFLPAEKTLLIGANWSIQKGRMLYRLFHQYSFDIVYEPTIERDVFAIIISDYMADFEKTNFSVYTKENFYRFTGNSLTERNEHNLGVIPFVVVNSESLDVDETYLDVASDFINSNLQFNVGLSNIAHLLHRESHGIKILTLPSESQMVGQQDANIPNSCNSGNSINNNSGKIALGPDHIITLYGDSQGNMPDLKYVSQNPQFESIISVLRFQLEMISVSLGLSPDTFFLNGATSKSATEVSVKKQNLVSSQKQFENLFNMVEKELFDLSKKIVESEKITGLQRLKDASLKLQFIKDRTIISDISTQELIQLQQAGIIDKVEVLKTLFPELDRTQLVEFQKEMGLEKEVVVKEKQIDMGEK